MTALLTIFGRFPTTIRRFPKLFRRPDERSRTISEIFRRLPKTFEEEPKIFRSYTNEFKYNLRDKLDVCKIIDVFASEDMENTPLSPGCSFV